MSQQLTRAQKEALRRREERQRNRREKEGQAQDERLRQHKEEAKRSRKKLLLALGLAVMVLVAGVGYAVYATQFAPSPLDGFARCLAERGAVMYGAIDWCAYTKEQAGMFGPSFRHLDYRDYSEGQDIKVTPTWEIDGKRYERVQSLEKLSGLTGCPLPGV